LIPSTSDRPPDWNQHFYDAIDLVNDTPVLVNATEEIFFAKLASIPSLIRWFRMTPEADQQNVKRQISTELQLELADRIALLWALRGPDSLDVVELQRIIEESSDERIQVWKQRLLRNYGLSGRT
jgi:hypothetical protein